MESFEVCISKNKELTKELYSNLIANSLYRDIIESKTFKRLKKINFLGAIDYIYKNKKRHSRYDHTITVTLLALRYSKLQCLNLNEEKYLVCAALLHDIGHGPLSHSMEPAFKKLFGITHHKAGNNIIRGLSPLGSEIKTILENNAIDIERLILLLDGKSKEKYSFALNNPINVDTIDGIIRSYHFLHSINKKSKLSLSVVPDIFDIVEATVTGENQTILDEFWRLKDRVYKELINKEIHIFADTYSQKFIEEYDEYKDKIQENDFYSNELEFKKNYTKLFEGLRQVRILEKEVNDTFKLKYINRNYKVNYEVQLNDITELGKKYVHSKCKSEVNIKRRGEPRVQKSLI